MSETTQEQTRSQASKTPKNRRSKKKTVKKCRNRSRANIKGVIPTLENIPEEKLASCVINLSTRIPTLTSHQLLLFYLGQSFAPTPPLPDYSQFRLDILKFAYRLRWAWFWYKNPTQHSTNNRSKEITDIQRKISDKQDTKPIKSSYNHCLELFIQKVSQELPQNPSSNHSISPDNIPKESRKALEEMKKWKDVVIRPADKGTKFIIMDREDYIQRTLVHLSDPDTFMIVEDKSAALRTIKDSITEWTVRHADEPGMASTISSLVIPNDSCKIGNNYINPKAHKPEQNYPSRMISTGCAAPTKSLAALTAVELSKVKLPYIIEDLNHFLRKIKSINQEESLKGKDIIHVSLDIVNMFPSISKSVGLEQCREHLNKRTNPL